MTRLLAFAWPGWVEWLLDDGGGPPCLDGGHSNLLVLLFHGANFVIGSAFLIVPLVVMRGYRRRRGGVPTGVIVAANVLAVVMALSRFGRVFEAFGTPYRLMTILDCLAAVASSYCVWKLYPTLTTILRLPSRHELHEALNKLQAEIYGRMVREQELNRTVDLLERKIQIAAGQVARLEHDRESSEWWRQQKDQLVEIRDRFRSIARAEEPN
jgi:hypothetical protein